MIRLLRTMFTLDFRTRLLLAAALMIGLAERIGWALARHMPWTTGEAPDVAIALAQGRGFADAFFPGQGPTAHVLPIAPMIAGGVYWLFGVRTPAAEAVLCAWSLLLTFGCYAVFAAAFAAIGADRRTVLGGFVLLCVTPVYTTDEAFEFRVWEGALGLLLAAMALLLFVRADRGERPRLFSLWRTLLPAAAFFVNPPVGVAAILTAALFWWRHRHRDSFWKAALGGILALALFVVPWTVRNTLVMGHPIPLRDDLGMELAVANFPGAVHPADPDAMLLSRLTAIQPYLHRSAYQAMWAAGGEVAYAQMLGHDAVAWMRAHPGDTARIWARHLKEMFFTSEWQFTTSHGVYLPWVRTLIVRAVALLSLVSLWLAARRRDARYGYIAIFIVMPTLLYIPFQPVHRYTWLLWPPFAYLAVDALVRIAAMGRSRGGNSPRQSSI